MGRADVTEETRRRVTEWPAQIAYKLMSARHLLLTQQPQPLAGFTGIGWNHGDVLTSGPNAARPKHLAGLDRVIE
jgi:hypothetical protein